MRLIHIVPAISEEASGPSYSVLRLCDALVANKHELTLAALDWAPLSKASPFLKVFPLGIGPRRLGRSPSMFRWLSARCAKGEVDVIHNHGMWQMNAVYPAWVSKKGCAQLVYSPRGAFSEWAMQYGSKGKKVFWPLFQEPALRRATCFHATAESEYEDIRRLGFRQPVAIIPNGIDVPLPMEKDHGSRRTLLFLSRIHKVKGLDVLLHAWCNVQDNHPDWRLLIVGSDQGFHGSSGYLEEIKALSDTLGLQRVEFAGPLYGAEKLRAYSEADLFVLPTYSENFGMVVAEALAMGIPAIVSKGAPWSGLDEEGAGWWIDVGTDALTACLQNALSCSSDGLVAMGEQGRAWMLRDFSWNGIGVKMAATYKWLCDRSLPVPAWVRLD